MNVQSLLARLAEPLEAREALRLTAAEVGRALAQPVRSELRAVQVGLGRQGGRGSEWEEGYRAALVDLLGALESELAEQERSGELQAQALRSGWKRALPELLDGPLRPSELEQRLGVSRSLVSRMLAEMRETDPPLVEPLSARAGEDGRSRPYQLTAAGEELARALSRQQESSAPAPGLDMRTLARVSAHLAAQLLQGAQTSPACLANLLQDTCTLEEEQATYLAQSFCLEAEALGMARRDEGMLSASGPTHTQKVLRALDDSLQEGKVPGFLQPALKAAEQRKATVLVRTEAARDRFNSLLLGPLGARLDMRMVREVDLKLGAFPAPSGQVVAIYENAYLAQRDRESEAELARAAAEAEAVFCLATPEQPAPEGLAALPLAS